MFKKIFIAVALAFIAFLIFVALQPSEVRVERTATIAAPPAVVFAQVNDFHKWEAWSPWAKLDPAANSSSVGKASFGSFVSCITRTSGRVSASQAISRGIRACRLLTIFSNGSA